MKLKSLLLGSIAAAGFSTGAYAADLSVLTSLDVCDALGISGLTISSDTNCLQITGEVSSEFNWGDYEGTAIGIPTLGGVFKVDDNDHGTRVGTDDNLDWNSEIDAYLKFVGTADSDFGPASATIKFDYDNDYKVINEGYPTTPTRSDTLRVEEAFVSIGDSTVIMIGQKGSIFKNGDDEPLTVWKPFNSEKVDNGVETRFTDVADGGPSHVIQVVSDLGNGVSVGVGLENLNGANNWSAPYGGAVPMTDDDGTFVGYVAYAGDGISAHLSVIGGGFADGVVEHWGVHGGFTGTFDNFTVVGAFAADDFGDWNALFSASATFDIFTLAAAVEATSGRPLLVAPSTVGDQWGFSASGSALVTDGVTLNLGFRWFDQDTSVGNTETWHIAGSLVAAVTETVTVTGELGFYSSNVVATPDVTYGSAELAWAPGGDFTSSVKGEINSEGAYKFTVKGKKTFQ